MDNQIKGQESDPKDLSPDNYLPGHQPDGGGIRIQINQADILPRTIKSRHVEAWIIFSGLDANKPTVGTQSIQAYWAYDSKKLYLYNPSTQTFNYASFT